MTSDPGFPSPRLLVPLTVANGVAVATLYVGQSVVARAVSDLGPSTTLSLMPGATLAGYAVGVAGLATLSGDLTEPTAMRRHFLFLVAALCAAGAAPTAAVLTGACLLIGIGCALTQRLLACAACAASAECRARTIGWIIAGGLLGILLARASVPAAAGLIGWRGVFCADAVLTCAFGLAAANVSARVHVRSPSPGAVSLSGAASLWRGEASLRQAALQQALVFAIFNMGWAVFPLVLHGAGTASALAMGTVALLGTGAALASGRLCGKSSPAAVARAGVMAVSVAGVAVLFGLKAPLYCYAGMGLLDAGTQVALVANQARAQALASSPAMRGRLAAIVTTIGFVGGALGSAAGNLVVWTGLFLSS